MRVGGVRVSVPRDHSFGARDQAAIQYNREMDRRQIMEAARQHGPVIRMGMVEGRLFCLWPQEETK